MRITHEELAAWIAIFDDRSATRFAILPPRVARDRISSLRQ